MRITSNSTGNTSSVQIIADGVFKCISNFDNINTFVLGSVGCVMSADIATISSLGVVQIGTGLEVDVAGVISTSIATTSSLGTVQIGSGLSITAGGILSGDVIPDATVSSKGVVQIGNNIDVAAAIISIASATNTTLGVVKSGNSNNITITSGDIDIGGNVALINVSNNWVATQYVLPSALVAGPTISVDAALSNIFTVTLNQNATLNNPTNLAAGGRYTFIITQDGTGSQTLAFDTVYKFKNGSDKILSTAANATDIITCVSNGTNLYCSLAKEFV